MVEDAREHADRGLAGRMEGHAEMDMSVSGGSVLSRVVSDRGFTATSHSFVMDWASVWVDIAVGLLIAGALAAWVPESFWQAFFFVDHPLVAKLWGPLVGPLVAMLSFVCSIGNVPLAAVLWNGGISFGGAISFIFADLIVIPILRIYRKYYGGHVTVFLFVTFYVTMAAAGLLVELLFGALGLIPTERNAQVVEASVTWNYTTVLNIVFLALAAVLVVRFLRTGGPAMLRAMSDAAGDGRGPHGVRVPDASGGPARRAGHLSDLRDAAGANDPAEALGRSWASLGSMDGEDVLPPPTGRIWARRRGAALPPRAFAGQRRHG